MPKNPSCADSESVQVSIDEPSGLGTASNTGRWPESERGACGRCHQCRTFPEASHKEMESYVNVGDMVLFSNGGFGPKCIQCWTRSEFDHVGIVVWTVSRLKTVNSKGKRFEIEYEGPHVLEAVSPVVICEPLEKVVKKVAAKGGTMFWRQLERPQLLDEPLDENGRPMPPRIVKRVVDDERHPFTTEYFPTQRKTVTHNGKQWAHDKLWIYNPIDPKSEDYKIYKAKIKDIVMRDQKMPEHESFIGQGLQRNEQHRVTECMQLNQKLSFKEWHQQAVDFIAKAYEKDQEIMVESTMKQDLGCWARCCACCWGEKRYVDNRTLEEKIAAEDSVFCSELAGVMLNKAGWRLGSVPSDAFLPKDFGDAANETLSYDLAEGVSLGPVIKVMYTQRA